MENTPEYASLEVKVEPESVFIDEGKMDTTLALLQNKDPADPTPDCSELVKLEGACEQMNPLIDEKLQEIDRKYSELSELNVKVTEALELYNKLMNEAPFYAAYSKIQPSSHYAPPNSAVTILGYTDHAGSCLHIEPSQGPLLQKYSLPSDQPRPLHSLPSRISAQPKGQPAQSCYINSGIYSQYMGQPAGTHYSQQMGVAMDKSSYQNVDTNMTQISCPMTAPSHPAPQQQTYYQQPLL